MHGFGPARSIYPSSEGAMGAILKERGCEGWDGGCEIFFDCRGYFS